MSAISFYTENFRNLVNTAAVIFHPSLNFIIGENGSGKTSLLEAIFVLGHGKSFRAIDNHQLIQYQCSSFIVTVKDDKNNQLGLSRDSVSNQVLLKLNGAKVNKLSDIAKNFPVQVVTPESFVLFFGGPKARRKFIDLGLFHVEQSFSSIWRDCTKILKQRNACLKSRVHFSTLNYWNKAFSDLAEQVSQYRKDYIDLLHAELSKWIELILPEHHGQFSIDYFQGWTTKRALIDILNDSYEREIKAGFSLAGPHRFDLKFQIDNLPIEQRLSRGQQKLFLLALTFAQSSLIAKVNLIKPILLIDDFGAELDTNSRGILAKAIHSLDCQVIITAIDERALQPVIPNDKNYHMFHVKHGEVTAIN